ncbi:hypothetical protein ACFVS9_10010 [Streptomyces sp. NPDC058008]|uniref:hypothetical protein n=1 Tax=Streptomyces sp. NPDC058008 TaxID=3346303 RepID=UPI0036EBA5CA
MRRKYTAIGMISLAGAFAALAFTGVGTSSAAETEDTPPYAVEDFAYPDSEKILAEQGIRLKSGDGHITLAECSGDPAQMEVWSRSQPTFCFEVTGATGYLALELDRVYGIKGNNYNTKVDMTVDNSEVSFDLVKNGWTQVGESADPQHRDHTLMEIHATR